MTDRQASKQASKQTNKVTSSLLELLVAAKNHSMLLSHMIVRRVFFSSLTHRIFIWQKLLLLLVAANVSWNSPINLRILIIFSGIAILDTKYCFHGNYCIDYILLHECLFLARATSLYNPFCPMTACVCLLVCNSVCNKFLGFWLVTSVLYRKCTIELWLVTQ